MSEQISELENMFKKIIKMLNIRFKKIRGDPEDSDV